MNALQRRFPRYSRLLALYPVEYRAAYGEQMLQTLADMLDDASASERRRIWIRTILDLPLSVIKQQVTYEGAVMATEVPTYIKQNARIGAWLLAPFFLLVILNSALGQGLHQTIFWHTNVLFMWLVLLPSVAIVLNLAALLRWMQAKHRSNGAAAWRLMIDLYHNWPVVSIILLGLAILTLVFGHDSVHCIIGNPIRVIHNVNQTMQCIGRG